MEGKSNWIVDKIKQSDQMAQPVDKDTQTTETLLRSTGVQTRTRVASVGTQYNEQDYNVRRSRRLQEQKMNN